ncbi:hypothetical protein [Mycobacteroides salmoniphilum]|uniref:hypothetical protein n=1 Tax=Mycobacteroides salmoniphilum TaxID=404941 RepID=UPI000993707B|nr:hypothetical protein [Mycobacteroides salmoniphilum]
MLTEASTFPRRYRADSLAGQVVALTSEHPNRITAAELSAALPGVMHSALSALLAARQISRLRRGVYSATAEDSTVVIREARPESADRPLHDDDVRYSRAELPS